MLEVRQLTKLFGITLALDSLSFTVNKGEILGFLGPNGAGKTTAMRILTGFLTPTRGSAWVDGHDLAKDSMVARKKIGYLPESVPLYRDMIVENYLRFVASIKGIARTKRNEHVNQIVSQCGLDQVRSRIIGKLSKGFRQRVGLAQALTGSPEILILDEPTEGLDPKQIIEIRQLIKNLGGEKTILLSTHILPEVSMTCDRVIIINKGKLVAVDSPQNLNKTLQKKMVTIAGFRGPEQTVVEKIASIPGAESIVLVPETSGEDFSVVRIEAKEGTDLRNKISEAIIHNGWQLLELHNERLSLEEIFIQLVTQEQEIGE